MQRQQFREETAPATPLYDAEAVRQVLARASEIESQTQAEPDALTPEQVETLGTELGLSPAAVRRALGERESQARTVSVRQRKRLTVAQVIFALIPGLTYAFVMAIAVYLLTPLFVSFSALWAMAMVFLLVFVLPPILCGLLGWKYRDLRLSLISSSFLGGLLPLAMVTGVSLRSEVSDVQTESWVCLLLPILGATFAAFGTRLRERYEQKKAERAR